MKLQFTIKDFKEFESDLIIMGFKKYNGRLHSEDYYYAKTIHRAEPDEDGDTRADLQLFILVYDFSKYPQHPEPNFIHLQSEVHVSRNIDERIDLVIDGNKYGSVHDLEQFSLKFYDFINSTV